VTRRCEKSGLVNVESLDVRNSHSFFGLKRDLVSIQKWGFFGIPDGERPGGLSCQRIRFHSYRYLIQQFSFRSPDLNQCP
jgi:hypothetical protein